MKISEQYWEIENRDLLQQLETSPSGISETEAGKRLSVFGHNVLRKKKKQTGLSLFLNQFKSPIILILIAASAVSAGLRDFTDTAIILAIIIMSGSLSFMQEHSAANAVEKLLRTVKTRVILFRDSKRKEVFIDEIVPGDIVFLSAGSLIPADCILIEEKDLFVNEAMLTGETFPVEKDLQSSPQGHSLAQRTNCVFMGTTVESGTATAVAVNS